jgi:ABC-2 type transport system permease protein
VGAIAQRELSAYFVSPVGWVIATVLVPFVSLFFLLQVVFGEQAAMDGVFSIVQFLMLFAVPAYTMRLLAEERRAGTLEVLLTSPLRDWELVLGKWLGVLNFYAASIAFTLVYVVLLVGLLPAKADLHVLGLTLSVGDLDYGSILTGYLGLLLLGCMLTAIGLLASSLTENQVIAFFVALVALLLIWYLGLFQNLVKPPLSQFFEYAAGANRFGSFLRGQVALKDVVYFLTLTAGALFCTARLLESRRWR